MCGREKGDTVFQTVDLNFVQTIASHFSSYLLCSSVALACCSNKSRSGLNGLSSYGLESLPFTAPSVGTGLCFLAVSLDGILKRSLGTRADKVDFGHERAGRKPRF
jgi:hypothetical protein